MKARLEAKLLGSADADPVRFSLPGYRARLYELRFGATPGDLLPNDSGQVE